jgi:tetratricopeptide (TPR) repeat protein
VHVAALGLFWWTDRRGWYEAPTFQSDADREQLRTLQEQATLNPQDEQVQLQVIDTLRRKGATNEARRRLSDFLKEHPRSAQGHLVMAFLDSEGKSHIPRTVRSHVEKALQLGLPDAANAVAAHALLGQHYLEVERTDEALRHLDEAVALAGRIGKASNEAHLFYLRALTQRRRGAYQAAAQDIEEAIRLASVRDHQGQVAHYENERQTIAHHRGTR